jgi:uncharacterized membrane-anchored protein YhcB (DUF1043 family)
MDQLQARVELLAKEREHALAEVEARKEALARTQTELEEYRGRVVEHFSSSFTLLRALTLQYRADCDHLAEGAGNLFAEDALEAGEASERSALPEPTGAEGRENDAAERPAPPDIRLPAR